MSSASVEQGPGAPPKPATDKDWWDIFEIVSQGILPLVIAAVGWLITDSVNTAFKRQELQISSAREMQELLLTVQNDETPRPQMLAAANAISVFGTSAIAPLITVLSLGGAERRDAVEKALGAVALTEPGEVCAALARVVASSNGRFSWQVHQSALAVIGDVGCPDAVDVLERFDRAIPSGSSSVPGDVKARFADTPEVTPEALDRLRAAAQRALRAARGEHPS